MLTCFIPMLAAASAVIDVAGLALASMWGSAPPVDAACTTVGPEVVACSMGPTEGARFDDRPATIQFLYYAGGLYAANVTVGGPKRKLARKISAALDVLPPDDVSSRAYWPPDPARAYWVTLAEESDSSAVVGFYYPPAAPSREIPASGPPELR